MAWIKLTGAGSGDVFAVQTTQILDFVNPQDEGDRARADLHEDCRCVIFLAAAGNVLTVRESFDEVARMVGIPTGRLQ